MKCIRVKCWFTDSEMILAKMVLSKNVKVIIRKIIDPIMIITSRNELFGEQYDIFGTETEVDKAIEFLQEIDVDIVEKARLA